MLYDTTDRPCKETHLIVSDSFSYFSRSRRIFSYQALLLDDMMNDLEKNVTIKGKDHDDDDSRHHHCSNCGMNERMVRNVRTARGEHDLV